MRIAILNEKGSMDFPIGSVSIEREQDGSIIQCIAVIHPATPPIAFPNPQAVVLVVDPSASHELFALWKEKSAVSPPSVESFAKALPKDCVWIGRGRSSKIVAAMPELRFPNN